MRQLLQTCLFSCIFPFSFFLAAKFIDEEDLSDVLCEFDAVIEDFTSPVDKRHFRYDEHLKTMKRRSSASVSDSGISDSESKQTTLVRTPGAPYPARGPADTV